MLEDQGSLLGLEGSPGVSSAARLCPLHLDKVRKKLFDVLERSPLGKQWGDPATPPPLLTLE